MEDVLTQASANDHKSQTQQNPPNFHPGSQSPDIYRDNEEDDEHLDMDDASIVGFPSQQTQSQQPLSPSNDQPPSQLQNGLSQQQQQQQMQQPIEILGAVKVRDGLFLGDEFASQDLEFVIANKVTHIINCGGRQIFNQWTPVGLIFDDHDQVAKEIYDFIEEANEEANGVLVHSVRGQSRACCVLSIYLMMKFRWTLLKSLEFINSRRPNLEIRASFLQQLSQWERRTREKYPHRTDRWEDLMHEGSTFQSIFQAGAPKEELLLRNTFMNAQMQPVNLLQQWKEDVMSSITQSARQNKTKLKWGDHGDEGNRLKLARENSDEDLLNKEESQIEPIQNYRREFAGKSLLKVKQAIEGHIHAHKLEEKPKVEEIVKQEQPNPIAQEDNSVENTPVQQKETSILQQERLQQRQKPEKKRPVTPLLHKHNSTDLLSTSPRSHDKPSDDKSLLSNQLSQSSVQKPKRASSSKRIDQKQKEEKDKRDQYKAKIAWHASSPKDNKNTLFLGTSSMRENNSELKKLVQQSPNKGSNQMFKKELLEKAKKALAEKSQLTVGLDLKKIQDTLNKLSKERTSVSQFQQQSNPNLAQKSQGNIINNNNINNFFIANASLLDFPKQQQQQQQLQIDQKAKTQSAIGQHHHKRANSGSLQIAQQIKQNLSGNLTQTPGSVLSTHRKNQRSEQINMQQFILSNTTSNDMLKNSLKNNTLQNRKDFKQIIKDLQKESLNSMANSQQFWLNQAKKYSMKNFTNVGISYPNQTDVLQISKKQLSAGSQIRAGSVELLQRPSSAQMSQSLNNTLGKQNNMMHNKNRKLRKSNDFIPTMNQVQISQPIKQIQRRAQTPMPQSPSNANFNQQHEKTQNKGFQKFANSSTNNGGLSVQKMSLNNSHILGGTGTFNNIGKPSAQNLPGTKKRSKSPLVTSQYKQKLQTKQNFMLMNNTAFGAGSQQKLIQSKNPWTYQ